jgi:hypothetical protein
MNSVVDPVDLEPCDVEPELERVVVQVLILERLLAVEEQIVHLPESTLERGRLGGCCGSGRVGMNLGQREVTKREANAIARLLLDALDLAVRAA